MSIFFQVYSDIKSKTKVNEQLERERDNLAVSDLHSFM